MAREILKEATAMDFFFGKLKAWGLSGKFFRRTVVNWVFIFKSKAVANGPGHFLKSSPWSFMRVLVVRLTFFHGQR